MDATIVEILFFLLSLLGVLIMIVGIPGNFVAVVVALLYTLFGKDGQFGWGMFFVFLGLAVSGEVVEQITGVIGAKRYGAGRIGQIGALLGGFVGALLGTMLLPVIGTVIGVFVGCFGLTFLFEYLFGEKNEAESARAGTGAVLGKAVAIAYKYAVGFVLLGLMAWRFWIAR